MSDIAGPDVAADGELAAFVADPELASMFVAEAFDHLGRIEAVVLALESSPGDVKLLNDLFRPFHTVKGNAGVLGIGSIEQLAHKVETLLDLARSGQHAIGRADIDVVLRAVDLLTAMVRDLSARAAGEATIDLADRRRDLIADVDALLAGGVAPTPPSPPGEPPACTPAAEPSARQETARDDAHQTVKIDTRKLDNLVDMVGELVIAQAILAEDPALARSGDERLHRRLAQLTRITSELQRNALAMRMVPIRQTFQKMARLVRDLGRKANKPIDLVLSGEDTELDRKVVEHLTDPLVHMVRNTIDHGIEPAAVRAAAGKPPTAVLRLSAFHEAGNIVIAIADDGAGLDTDRIRARGIERGLIAEDASLTAADMHQLIFQPGFSTADRITELSGRGVGMDVVKRNIEALRGRIEIQTARAVGTTFVIRVPLTLAIVDGILVGVGAERFVIPTFAVRESLRPRAEQVHTIHERGVMLRIREALVPVLRLADAFGIAAAREALTEATVVVIEDNGRRVALAVDDLLGKQEVVIKTLGDRFHHVRGVAGGAILGDGRIGLILDAGGLAALAASDAPRAA